MEQNQSTTDAEKIQSLVELSPLEYDRERKLAAEELGVSVGALDETVKQLRKETSDVAAKGRAITLYEPEPWPESVDGADTLTEAANHILRHMMMSEADTYACVLWACHTFMFEDFDHSPRLCITAHAEESGKTVLMTHLVGNLCNKPQPVELMKPSPFFRLAEGHRPTFLIDECDVFVHADMDLLAALNSGWEPHGGVPRCSGDDNEPRIFSTFTPTAMAGIQLHKKLPATTLGRSIVIGLERAAEGEIDPADIFNRKLHQPGIRETGRKIARFIDDNREYIANCKPILPVGVRNRLADKWTPLLAIAEIAGGEWPENAKKALYGQSDLSTPSRAMELLQDVKEIMPSEGHIFTRTLIDRVCNLDGSPWSEYNFTQWDAEKKKISDRQIANLLGQYGLESTTVYINGIRGKGYKRDKLELSFKRYISTPLLPPELAVTQLPSSKNNALDDSGAVTPDVEVTDNNTSTSNVNAGGNGVTAKNGVSPEIERFVIDED